MVLGRWLLMVSLACLLGSCSLSEGSRKVKFCQSLNTVITTDELFGMIGRPMDTESTDQGMVLYYTSNPSAAGPVRFLVETKTNRVIGKKCFDDEEWMYFTNPK